MITLNNFGPNNRTKVIGNSMYRICNTDPINGTGVWYIHETFNDGNEFSQVNAFHSKRLEYVIDSFNRISKEKEIIQYRIKE